MQSLGSRQSGAMRAVVAASLAVAGTAAGCMKTNEVDQGVTASQLTASNKAVVLMRIGSAAPVCEHVGVLLGVREGAGFRKGSEVAVANVRSITQTQVAEIELDPGEHHVIGYSCVGQKGPAVVTDPAGGQLYKTSYAYFSVAAGEIVNVGYFHFGASHAGRSAFGRPIKTDVEITDWPLEEIERFRKLRPQMFDKMKTRLMVAGDAPPSAAQQAAACETWRKLKAEGKAATMPKECAGR